MPAREEIAQYADEMGKTYTQLYNWFNNHRLPKSHCFKTEPGQAPGIKEEVKILKDKIEQDAPKDGEVAVYQGKVKTFLIILIVESDEKLHQKNKTELKL